ncbi:M56 family metallopeptidase [Mesonia maritima]|uniref:Beta-lactamase regulating signal transducer with metallopeptidase domain n=1 Tax=Mesonia maritima TaxID=1793873 RepID=A0ABU1K702_9FLAO|nr:M56 family metallopeptidase [Mesonia maritima]MDR6301379.1 beta-lactamase regulating signal transducer with metallopeptidase domain [Mesonia maritima]
MENYIIQFTVFLFLFFAAYLLFFKRETFFQTNRFYLLFTPVLALILPFLSFDFFQEKIKISQAVIHLPSVFIGNFSAEKLPETTIVERETFWSSLNFLHILIGIYILGIAFSIFLLVRKILAFRKFKEKGTITIFQKISYWQIPNSRLAFTFLNQIFIGENIQSAEKEQILQHELVHVKQNHTFDLLFMELLKIIFWFHPAVYGYQHQLKILHEFIADKEVSRLSSTRNYYENLLNSIFNTEKISFINQFFNHSLIKKRIVMLQKSKSSKCAKLKYFLLIPLILGMLTYVSCSEDNVEKNQDVESVEKPPIPPTPPTSPELPELLLPNETENYGVIEVGDINNLTDDENRRLRELSKKIIEDSNMHKLVITDGENQKVFDFEKSSSIQNEGIPFSEVETIPIFPGCEGLEGEAAKKCMAEKVSEFVNSKFDTKKVKPYAQDGTNRIYVKFTIDENGKIKTVKARAAKPELSEEAEKAINQLPQMKPGEVDGKPVSVVYTLPIIFQVEK